VATYKEAKDLKGQDVVELPNGTKTVAGKSIQGQYVNVVYIGGFTARYTLRQTMKLKESKGGRTFLPAYMK